MPPILLLHSICIGRVIYRRDIVYYHASDSKFFDRSSLLDSLQTMPPISNCAKAPDIACAENIALCLFLHPIPERPSQNPVTSLATTKEGYILPFDKERALANIPAFLAKSKDGSDYIPAICVEEDKRSHLNVLLAINKRSRCDGDYIHRELKHSFEKIFAVLSTASYG